MILDASRKPQSNSPEFALTPVQLGMVYESVLARRMRLNLEQVVVHLDDEVIEPARLRDAWLTVAQRHPALRLRIMWTGREGPVQTLGKVEDIDLTVEDWQSRDPSAQTEALERFLRIDRERGVDLERAPSWRVALFRMGPRQSVMVWTIHHALVDGRSMALVLGDLSAALSGAGPVPGSDTLGTSFSAFCDVVNTHDTAAAEAHFRSVFKDFEPASLLAPIDSGVAAGDPAPKRQIARALDTDLTASLHARAKASEVTTASLVNAAWALVLARWGGQREAVFGVTRSGRHIAPGCGDLVGCLINTLPLRVDVAGAQTLGQLLRAVRAATVAIQPLEFAALTDIRRWADVPAEVPLFDSMVMYERASMTGMMRRMGPAWQNRRVDLREEGALPMTLAVYADDAMQIVLEHDPSLVAADRAQAMLDHVAALLGSFAQAADDAPLAQVAMLSAQDQAALLHLGQPDRPLPQAVPCIATRFEATAAAQPQAMAVSQVGTEDALDFQTLDQRANGLAHRLVAAGVEPGQIVAICLGRSVDFVVSMLAIHKAGAAFLPVDPSYPAPVIDHMLTDSRARLLITRAGVGPERDAGDGVTVLTPDADSAATPPRRPAPDPDRLAYVIYTSGSTGKPKGVRVPQRAISAHASATIEAFALTPADRCLQFASLSFDVSIEEMLPTLIAGASLVMRDDAMSQSISVFLDAVEAQRLSVLNLPTAFWHILIDEMVASGRRLPGCVRLVIAGGEQINPRSLATWQRLAPEVRWLNGYGPTETTITCTLHEPGPVSPDHDIPIGRPTLHACAYVLAADGSLAPRGCPGDLWIGGPAVSDGYIDRPEQTAQVFRPDHLRGFGRIYRSGDRAYWREDGTLAFLGRQDRQVKLRGFRIDLRHIESVLEREDGVGRALVRVLDADKPGARLVAWVTGADGLPPPEVATLEQAVASNLAPHMRPAIVPIDEFPRTAGGKIDTAALPAPEARAPAGDATDAAPADARTLQIAGMMAGLLRLETVGPDESFHALGGHSLLAVRLIGQIEQAFGTRLAVGDLHRNPTPRALSAALDASTLGPRYIIPIQPNGTLPPLFGVHVLGAYEGFYRPMAQYFPPDQPVLGLTVGLLTADTPVGVRSTARAYFDDIQQHYPEGPIRLAAVSLGSYIAFELAHQLRAAGRTIDFLAFFDAEGPAGRDRVKGVKHLVTHLRLLKKKGGIKHLRHILSNRKTDLRNQFTKWKLRIADKKGEEAPLTLDAFVAANTMAVEAYDAKPLDVPITIFRAKEDLFDSPACYRTGLGWAPVAAAGFKVIDVPGDHLSLLEDPNAKVLAGHMCRGLTEGQG